MSREKNALKTKTYAAAAAAAILAISAGGMLTVSAEEWGGQTGGSSYINAYEIPEEDQWQAYQDIGSYGPSYDYSYEDYGYEDYGYEDYGYNDYAYDDYAYDDYAYDDYSYDDGSYDDYSYTSDSYSGDYTSYSDTGSASSSSGSGSGSGSASAGGTSSTAGTASAGGTQSQTESAASAEAGTNSLNQTAAASASGAPETVNGYPAYCTVVFREDGSEAISFCETHAPLLEREDRLSQNDLTLPQLRLLSRSWEDAVNEMYEARKASMSSTAAAKEETARIAFFTQLDNQDAMLASCGEEAVIRMRMFSLKMECARLCSLSGSPQIITLS